MKKIAIFVSGNGSNAENIFRHFSQSELAEVTLFLSDNPKAYALQRAKELNVETVVVPRDRISNSDVMLKILIERNIDYIVLAGFLSLIPAGVIESYCGRIINIHPALLPAYGGKGMYGDHVHSAVIRNKEKESGITVHHVNTKYDEGAVIAQYSVNVLPEDTPETLAAKIHELEYKYFPLVIEEQLKKL